MYVPRAVEARFSKVASAYNIVALTGPRQSGKTTTLKKLSEGMNVSYVLFDDPDAKELFEADIKKFDMQYVEGHDLAILDEVHYCKDAGTRLKYLADTGRRIWVTSSSEALLGKDVLAYLVGRVSIVRLYPYSLPEFLQSKNIKETTPSSLERAVWEHMTYGGYPKVCASQEVDLKKIMLSDLYETMIMMDVAKTFSIGDHSALQNMVRYLAANTGMLLSYDSISKTLKVSFETVKKYLDALEKSNLISLVRPFHTNMGKEITKQPKAYFVDTGLRNQIVRAFSNTPDGRLFENYVFCELLKNGAKPRYWRTKSQAEVDFIVEVGGKPLPLEVKLSEPANTHGLASFIKKYRPEKALIIHYQGEYSQTQSNGCQIIHANMAEAEEHIKNAT